MASNASEGSASAALPREDLIDTAVRFLTNPNVVGRPFQQKQMFLKNKGMTDEEVRISCERANLYPSNSQQQQLQAVIPMPVAPQYIVSTQEKSLWIRARDVLHTLALLGGLGYAIYWVYKVYVEPFLFGRPKPKKSTSERLASIEEAITNVTRCTSEFRTEMRSEINRITQERESGATRNLADMKSDISTVKGLLLSRQQFPSAPKSNPIKINQKPSIPAWQLSSEQKKGTKNIEEDSPVQSGNIPSDSKDHDQESFGSCKDVDENHSSKVGVQDTVTNGSDSSLEMVSD